MKYLQHNEELEGKSFKPEEPVVFTKADSSLLKDGRPFFLPEELGRIDYETELVVRICRLGKSIPERFAHRYYDAVTVGIDFTARDLQRRFKQEGRPWELCKGFDGAAAIGQWVPVEMFQNVQAIHFRLDITSSDDRLQGRGPVTVQRGCTSDMLYTVDQIVSYISRWFTLKTGDIIYTGTPTGVGPVHIDDHLEGWLEDRKVLEFNVK